MDVETAPGRGRKVGLTDHLPKIDDDDSLGALLGKAPQEVVVLVDPGGEVEREATGDGLAGHRGLPQSKASTGGARGG